MEFYFPEKLAAALGIPTKILTGDSDAPSNADASEYYDRCMLSINDSIRAANLNFRASMVRSRRKKRDYSSWLIRGL